MKLERFVTFALSVGTVCIFGSRAFGDSNRESRAMQEFGMDRAVGQSILDRAQGELSSTQMQNTPSGGRPKQIPGAVRRNETLNAKASPPEERRQLGKLFL